MTGHIATTSGDTIILAASSARRADGSMENLPRGAKVFIPRGQATTTVVIRDTRPGLTAFTVVVGSATAVVLFFVYALYTWSPST